MESAQRQVKIGVIGCGEIAQWMHLPFLTELPGFQVTAVCDISQRVVNYVGERFGVEQRFTDYNGLLARADVEAVLIATLIHSDPTIASVEAGKHVLVEKPMAFNLQEAEAMVEAAERAGVVLMVAYMKRYDPGYQYGQRLMQEMQDVTLIRVHDLYGPNPAFVGDVTTTVRDRELEARTRPEMMLEIRRRQEAAIGAGRPERIYAGYDLLGSLASHDMTILRGAFGSPRSVMSADIWQDGAYILATMDYGDGRRCVFEIGTTRKKEFDEELAAFGWNNTVRVRFPSPYIKYAPTLVEVTEQEESGALMQRTITASYEESFRRELEHFHDCVVNGREPVTAGRDAIEDVRLQIAIARAALSTS